MKIQVRFLRGLILLHSRRENTKLNQINPRKTITEIMEGIKMYVDTAATTNMTKEELEELANRYCNNSN